MSRKRNITASYVPHKQTGRGRLVWYDATGVRRQKLLPGPFGSAGSLAAKAALELELATSPTRSAAIDPKGLTLAELFVAYLDDAEKHYRGPDGAPTSKLTEVKLVIKTARQLYPDILVSDFSPAKLKAIRQVWVDAGRVRTECNRRAGVLKRIIRWGVSEELVPVAVYQALTTVTGLQRGRSSARESEPVGPVDDVTVDATLTQLNRHVRGLVEFQTHTGCRPGEACALRRRDIDTSGEVWLYRPVHHKTSYRGHSRLIAIGPKAQALLREYFTPAADDYVFSPRRAVEEVLAERATNRKTPRYSSHTRHNAQRKKRNPKRKPAERYNRASYGHAIARACDRAFPPGGELARRQGESAAKWLARLTDEQRAAVKKWQREHRWHPHQLRHTFATKVRKEHGLEAAQVLLGHSRADVTQVYAARDEALAATVATAIG